MSETSIQRVAAVLWLIATAILLGTQLFSQFAWHSPPYSWSDNNISDLGNVNCAMTVEHARHICSPRHAATNAGFMIYGVLLLLGVLGIGRFGGGFRSAVTKILVSFAAIGWILAGIYPADVNENAHVAAAVLLIFLAGNISIIVAAPLRDVSTGLVSRWFGPALGGTGIVATFLFLSGTYAGLGMGGMERLAVFPLQVWSATIAALILKAQTPAAIGNYQDSGHIQG